MATWKLSPQHKKSAVEKMFFYNGSKAIIVEQGWRWGTFTVESDERPLTDSELVNEDGYELGCIDNDESWELSEMTDGCWLDINALRNATEEDVTAFEQAWEQDGYDGVEELGWSNDDTEYYYLGPLELTNEDTGQVFLGDTVETQAQTEQQLMAELDELIASMPDPDEPAVTDWFPITVDPVHVGSYQITGNKYPNWPFPQHATWDGKSWSNLDIVSWRGLANKPE
jgi:hypothetical protein